MYDINVVHVESQTILLKGVNKMEDTIIVGDYEFWLEQDEEGVEELNSYNTKTHEWVGDNDLATITLFKAYKSIINQ